MMYLSICVNPKYILASSTTFKHYSTKLYFCRQNNLPLRLLIIILFSCVSVVCLGQNADSSKEKKQQKKEDTAIKKKSSADTVTSPKQVKDSSRNNLNPSVSHSDSEKAKILPSSVIDSNISNHSQTSSLLQSTVHPPNKDSVQSIPVLKSTKLSKEEDFALTQKILLHHPYFDFHHKAIYPPYTKKINPPGKEKYFYTIAVLLLIFALLKTGFEKYFSDMLHLFFRRSLKQRQLKQQLIQNSLPSLLFNLYFIITAGLYAALIIETFLTPTTFCFWELLAGCCFIIGAVYVAKYFVLKFIGWTFRIKKLTDNYIFLIFLVNKILILVLLPLTIIIALSNKELVTIAWTLSWLIVLALLAYRYLSAIHLVKKEKNISFFHFLLYASAFEILPTIMLYKGILSILK